MIHDVANSNLEVDHQIKNLVLPIATHFWGGLQLLLFKIMDLTISTIVNKNFENNTQIKSGVSSNTKFLF